MSKGRYGAPRRALRTLSMLAVLAMVAGLLAVGGVASGHTAGDPYQTDLIADGGDPSTAVDAGDVLVWNDGYDLFVKYVTDGWCLTETHLAVEEDLADIPQTKKGNPIPGQFEYSMDHDCVSEYTYEIPLTWNPETPLFIAAHSVVYDLASETSMTIFSDTNVMVTSFNGIPQTPANAVAAYEPVGYMNCGSYLLSPTPGSVWDTQTGGSASNDPGGPFDGATWIWRTANPVTPDAGEYATFERTFDLPGPPADGSILITADNGYQVSLNGAFLGQAQIYSAFPGSLKEDGVDTTNWQSPETWALPLQSGTNTLSIVAANEEAFPDTPNIATTGIGGEAGGVCPNPGALIFKAEVGYYADHETAWGDGTEFDGKNWGMHFTYTVQEPRFDAVAAGTGLRNRDGGDIVITGIPAGATVEEAYLVWAILYDGTPPAGTISLDGNALTGTLQGISGSLCWGDTNTVGYGADVTSIVAAKGNGTYRVSGAINGVYSPATNDPYGLLPYTDGASLFVIYNGGGANGQVLSDWSYDTNTAGVVSRSFSGISSVGGSAKLLIAGPDGQGPATETLTLTGGSQISFADTWDGSDPIDGPGPLVWGSASGNLWDTDVFDVSSILPTGQTALGLEVGLQTDCIGLSGAVLVVEQ